VSEPDGEYRATFDVQATRPTRLRVAVCEMHLLYEAGCRQAVVDVAPGTSAWQHVSVPLVADPASGSPGAARGASVSIAVMDAGHRVGLDNVQVRGGGADLVRNGDFAHALARWFPSAQRYFVPWHIDSLPLELLIERGVAGIAAFVFLLVRALQGFAAPANRERPMTPVLAASLAGALSIGLISSVLDVARVSYLVFLFMFIPLSRMKALPARPAST
jgi:hypothetical protein